MSVALRTAPLRHAAAVLASSGALLAAALLPKFARAAGARDPRLIVIVLRGALDGLSDCRTRTATHRIVSLHGALALSTRGDHPAVPLDGFFALQSCNAGARAPLQTRATLTIVHATATSYRERSHFDGQDVLESGYARPWLGRLRVGSIGRLGLYRPATVCGIGSGLAVGPATPLVLRGAAHVLGVVATVRWQPPRDDLAARVMDLYAHRDPCSRRLRWRRAWNPSVIATHEGMMAAAAQKRGGMNDAPSGMRQAAAGRLPN